MKKNLAAYTLNDELVERGLFYRAACDPQRSVVVEACAGAGKTWMLVSRIIRALLAGAKPHEIVAITFTRKAAGEMRQRLGEWLAEFAAADDAARQQALRERGMSAAEAAAAAPALQALQSQLLHAGRGVEIRTFHAWFSQLLRAAPMQTLQELGIAPELQLLEDESELAPDLWRRFHAAVLADEQRLADYQALLLKRGRHGLQRWLQAGFEKRVELRLAQHSGVLAGSMPDGFSVMPELAGLAHPLQAFERERASLQALAAVLGAAKGATAQKKAVEIEQALALADAQQAFEGVRRALFTDAGTPRKALGESAELSAATVFIERLTRALAQQEASVEHQQMCGLALLLLAEYDKLKLARGLVDMNDLERGALAILGDAELAGQVQERLDMRVRHLLIDEFQDTSPQQWHALYSWLSAYSGAGGGGSGRQAISVFVVGDPKQSIYRFRRAEPRVFAAAREFVQHGLGGAVLACDHTRRNSLSVLSAVNEAFAAASQAQLYSGFRAHTTEPRAPGDLDGVFHLPETDDDEPTPDDEFGSAARDAEAWRPSLTQARHEPELQRRAAEARRICRAIQALLAGGQVQPQEIYVLARKREPLRVLAQWLKSAGVPHAAPEDSALLDAPDVRDLLALLDVLASPGHNLSLAQALRSPLLGASADDLLQLSLAAGGVAFVGREAPPRRSWWDALHALPEAELSPALQRARALLARWSALAQRRSPHDLLDAIVHEGELMARLAAALPAGERRSRLHAVEALLALALDLDGGRYASVYGFVRALKSRSLKLKLPAQPQAVQLLTVHGAKGLEADVVFLMDCDAASAKAETATLAIDWPVQALSPVRVAFVASESRVPPALEALLDEEKAQRQREELNALYVAMTRARSRLVLSRTEPARASSTSSWWARLQPLSLAWDLAAPPSSARFAAPAEAGFVLLDLPAFQPPSRPASKPAVEASVSGGGSGEAEDPENAKLGEAMHRVLEWFSGAQAGRYSVEALLASAAQMFGLDARLRERLSRSVHAILNGSQTGDFFKTEGLLWAGNEVSVSLHGQDMRIDRLVCRPGAGGEAVWWVLDYKLSAAPKARPEYIAQMRRYRDALKLLQPGETWRCAFITGQGRLEDCTDLLD